MMTTVAGRKWQGHGTATARARRHDRMGRGIPRGGGAIMTPGGRIINRSHVPLQGVYLISSARSNEQGARGIADGSAETSGENA